MNARTLFCLVAMIVLLLTLLPTAAGLAAPPPQEPVTPEPFPFSDRYPAQVVLETPAQGDLLLRYGIDIGSLQPLSQEPGEPLQPLLATIYVNDAEVERLTTEGLDVHIIPNESLQAFRAYGPGSGSEQAWPTYDEWVTRMQTIAVNYPNIVRMMSIGQSVQGRELWVLKISDNPDLEEDEPEFKYSSTMHGIEGVGTEMTLRLAELLTSSYGSLPTLTELVDGMEIWLFPLHNPDGYVAGTYYNANGVNLNRDFPDRITDPVDDPTGREPET